VPQEPGKTHDKGTVLLQCLLRSSKGGGLLCPTIEDCGDAGGGRGSGDSVDRRPLRKALPVGIGPVIALGIASKLRSGLNQGPGRLLYQRGAGLLIRYKALSQGNLINVKAKPSLGSL
jgi:hypothetical protein